jgi:hypothetical protein
MRKALLLLPLLLAGCVDDTASYSIEGNDHTVMMRAVQDYFWDDTLTLYVTASRLPDCQRRFPLPQATAANVEYELYSHEDNVWTLKGNNALWSFETQGCTQLPTPSTAPAQLVGKFVLEGGKLRFDETKPPVKPVQAQAE